MESVILISAITCILLMLVAFWKPSINIGNTSVSIFWIVPFVGGYHYDSDKPCIV